MNANKITIKGIFNGSRELVIPFYQRAYVWKEENWERFLNDLEIVTFTKKPYFIGSIILKAEQVNTWDSITDKKIIVDGQQRLTTLVLFFKALCLKTNKENLFERDFVLENGEIALKTGKNDCDAFRKVMEHTKDEPIKDDDNTTNIIKAFNFFLKNIDIEKVDRMIIQQNLEFVCIDLDANEDEQQVFDTINSLGVKLTTAELLKNYFYSNNDEIQYEKNWAPAFEKDDETKKYWNQEFEAGNIKKTLIDEFFDSFFKIHINNSHYQISSEDKNLYGRSDYLFSSYKDFIKKYCNGDKNAVLSNLFSYAELFRKTFDPSWKSRCIPKEFCLERLNVIIFGLKNTTLIPYVLFVQKNVSDYNERNDIFAILEKFIMRRIITKENTKNYHKMFQSLIANKVLSKESLLKSFNEVENDVALIPTDADLERCLKESKLNNLQAKGVIYMIETSLRDSKDSTALLGFDKYSLEHLMPKNWRKEWKMVSNEKERDATLQTLGNLAIITQSLNASIRDGDWTTKLHGKNKSPGLISCSSGLKTMEDVINKDIWDEDQIKKRAKWLYDIAIDLWSI